MNDLTSHEATALMEAIFTTYTDEQIGETLLALNEKGITATELAAFVDTLDAKAVHATTENCIDLCGTGGDGNNTFNISTLAALVVAACGVPVAKHGNRAVSSQCGSADILEQLGVRMLPPEKIAACIKQCGIGFLFAPTHHPAFKRVAAIREKLGVKTVFNMMGPLLNPAHPVAQVIGVFDPRLTALFAQTLQERGMQRALVVHGDGLDEITLCGTTTGHELNNGRITTFSCTPEDFGLPPCTLDDLRGDNATIFNNVLAGAKGPCRNIVLANAAAGLYVAEKAATLKEGVAQAATAIDTGAAQQLFDKFVKVTNDLG
ncbi:MAG: anthranilate phosphoribosyltransferase [Candidatus Woesearchaeota archaeon]|nr:anthranilate phosphoribosyltransferase [Candidatus Woesearchaeota archaeon]